MFNRHVYTCPDMLYVRNRQKKINIATLVINAVFFGGLMTWSAVEARLAEKENTEAPE